LDLPFSIFRLNIFWIRGGGYCGVGVFKNEYYDGDHYLGAHSLSTSNSNNTHREWLSSLLGVSRQARVNGLSLEMRWTVDTITISQSVVVVKTVYWSTRRPHRTPSSMVARGIRCNL
jgi:hypothetical protein